ncbi:pre-mRNA-splicing factor CWC25 homolog [Onthophagus taurus]|uniref:pre-mRNA-splicing factor CWC25 homolog n=1 Tax=Onthophagus taurus TaxID=166361 RepID=UPI000C204D9D|nr:pre-mRNA-splicing factor CWC25 homolog [Onthophagus taurus]
MSYQNDEKLDWMYKNATSLVDREEYLLGRKIDKTLEQLNAEEKEKELGITVPKNHVEHECIPPSIRDYNKISIGEQQVDLATKLQEDPLVAIRKREEETRKEFLQNPVQLKKMQMMLDMQMKKNKKSKKKKKIKNLDEKILELLKKNSSDEFDEDIDKILLKKLRKLRSKLSEEDLKEIMEYKKPVERRIKEEKIDSDDEHHRIKRPKQNDKRFQRPRYDGNSTQFKRNKLSEDEMERKRREMMDNASWRDKERVKNVKRYRDEDKKEAKQQDYNTEFLHRELLKSANNSSVESRIKSNINSIQRSKGDMDKHFSRRN